MAKAMAMTRSRGVMRKPRTATVTKTEVTNRITVGLLMASGVVVAAAVAYFGVFQNLNGQSAYPRGGGVRAIIQMSYDGCMRSCRINRDLCNRNRRTTCASSYQTCQSRCAAAIPAGYGVPGYSVPGYTLPGYSR